jgi:hypothetical protein
MAGIRDKALIDEVLTRQIAMLSLGGERVLKNIAEQCETSVHIVKTVMASERYQAILAEEAHVSLGSALAALKQRMSKQADKALKVIDKAMDVYLETGEGSREAMEASKMVLRSQGLDAAEDRQNDTTLNIIMPGGAEPVTIEVENDNKE